MYKNLLSMNWNDILRSDLIIKSNTSKHVVEVPANQFYKDDDSVILIFYNIYTQNPMILLHRYNVDREPSIDVVDGFVNRVEGDYYLDGYVEVLYISEILKDIGM